MRKNHIGNTLGHLCVPSQVKLTSGVRDSNLLTDFTPSSRPHSQPSVIRPSHLVFHTTPPTPPRHSPTHPYSRTLSSPLCRPALQCTPAVSDLRAFLCYLFSLCSLYLPLELSNECQLPILEEETPPVLGTSPLSYVMLCVPRGPPLGS